MDCYESKRGHRAHLLQNLRHGRNAPGLRGWRQGNHRADPRAVFAGQRQRRRACGRFSKPPAILPTLALVAKNLMSTRSWLCNELSKDGRFFIPSQANFVMIDMQTDVRPIIDQFAARNILVGRRFPSMSNYLRITIGTQQEIETFLATLREIAPANASKAA